MGSWSDCLYNNNNQNIYSILMLTSLIQTDNVKNTRSYFPISVCCQREAAIRRIIWNRWTNTNTHLALPLIYDTQEQIFFNYKTFIIRLFHQWAIISKIISKISTPTWPRTRNFCNFKIILKRVNCISTYLFVTWQAIGCNSKLAPT